MKLKYSWGWQSDNFEDFRYEEYNAQTLNHHRGGNKTDDGKLIGRTVYIKVHANGGIAYPANHISRYMDHAWFDKINEGTVTTSASAAEIVHTDPLNELQEVNRIGDIWVKTTEDGIKGLKVE